MTTYADGAAPSVTPEPGAGSGPRGARSRAERDDLDEALDGGSSWLREEIQRRMAEARTHSGGRHARRDTVASPGSVGYVPRHSVATPGPGAPRPGPVGGSPSPHASELLRRERTSVNGASAWSGPPRRTDAGPGRPAPDGDAQTTSPSPFPRRVPGANGAPPVPSQASPPQAAPTSAAPAAPPSPRRRFSPSPTPRVAAPSSTVPTPVVPAVLPAPDPDPVLPSASGAPGAVDETSPAPSTAPNATGAAEVTEQTPGEATAGWCSRSAETAPVPIVPGTQETHLPLGGPTPGPDWLGPPVSRLAVPGSAAPSEADDPDATVEQTVVPAAGSLIPIQVTPVQGTGSTGSAVSGRVVLDPVFTARTPEPGSRARERPAASAPVTVPEQRGAEQSVDAAPDQDDEDDLQSKRVRVVLAERRNVARPVRMVVDVQESTGVGEFLRRNLIRTQLMIALRFAVGAGLALGLLPVLFAFVPEVGLIEVFGIRLPWLMLGGLVYPFLLGLGWWHSRLAERVEHSFAEDVQG